MRHNYLVQIAFTAVVLGLSIAARRLIGDWWDGIAILAAIFCLVVFWVLNKTK